MKRRQCKQQKVSLSLSLSLSLYFPLFVFAGLFGNRIVRDRFEYEFVERHEDGTEVREPIKTGRKNPPTPHGLTIVRGSAYGSFSRPFVEFMLSDQRARDLLNWSRSTYSPDEFYWATLHHSFANPDLKAPGAFSGRNTV